MSPDLRRVRLKRSAVTVAKKTFHVQHLAMQQREVRKHSHGN
jgi:hypothetical protein